jgi:hypothetical protein
VKAAERADVRAECRACSYTGVAGPQEADTVVQKLRNRKVNHVVIDNTSSTVATHEPRCSSTAGLRLLVSLNACRRGTSLSISTKVLTHGGILVV